MTRLQQCLKQNKLSLIVSLPANDIGLARAALEAGADGLKVHFNVGHRASGTHFGSLESYRGVFERIRGMFDGPLGVVPAGSLEDADAASIRQLAPLGFDFYSIYAHHLPSHMLYGSGLEKTFAINHEYDLSLAASARHFGFAALEASIVPGDEYGTPLSFADVLKYRRLVEQAQIPVLVPSQRKLVPDDIRALSDAGVQAVLLGAIVTGRAGEQMLQQVAAFRDAIDRLT
ncbi:hypothetical protein [Cohnella nanjingensis]|uniref:Thiamine phosphate synthase/TenI domain-containing protein n=1 Tax=Cohnella nanjingensis TaxID=1387779 RepID=A0A7X0VHY6_9BACL|nr:hypothetical protein [Cohnella nanjingensis]MBB6674635.1 hypothetical protein [Cohnella nanjingensis]